jgi:hypothetical protein
MPRPSATTHKHILSFCRSYRRGTTTQSNTQAHTHALTGLCSVTRSLGHSSLRGLPSSPMLSHQHACESEEGHRSLCPQSSRKIKLQEHPLPFPPGAKAHFEPQPHFAGVDDCCRDQTRTQDLKQDPSCDQRARLLERAAVRQAISRPEQHQTLRAAAAPRARSAAGASPRGQRCLLRYSSIRGEPPVQSPQQGKGQGAGVADELTPSCVVGRPAGRRARTSSCSLDWQLAQNSPNSFASAWGRFGGGATAVSQRNPEGEGVTCGVGIPRALASRRRSCNGLLRNFEFEFQFKKRDLSRCRGAECGASIASIIMSYA